MNYYEYNPMFLENVTDDFFRNISFRVWWRYLLNKHPQSHYGRQDLHDASRLLSKTRDKNRQVDDDGISIEIMFLMHVIMQTRNEKYIMRRIEMKQKFQAQMLRSHRFGSSKALYWPIYYKLSPNYSGIYNKILVAFRTEPKQVH